MKSKALALFGVATAAAALGMALWWQYHDGLAPCSLCWVQRGETLVVGAAFLAAMRWRRTGFAVVLLAALAGLGTAGLQWAEVQGAAPRALNVCTLTATGEPSCAVAGAHRMLGLPLVAWSSIAFLFWCALAVLAWYAAVRESGRSDQAAARRAAT